MVDLVGGEKHMCIELMMRVEMDFNFLVRLTSKVNEGVSLVVAFVVFRSKHNRIH